MEEIQKEIQNKVYSFGFEKHGQLGRKVDSIRSNFLPSEIDEISEKKIVSIACGAGFTTLISGSGEVFVCGGNNEIKKPDTQNLRKLGAFRGKRIIKAAAGAIHACFVEDNGDVYRTSTENGKTEANFPALINDLKGIFITQVCCGALHTVLVSNIGYVFSYGNNSHGQLGHGGNSSDTPKRIQALQTVFVVSASCGGSFSVFLSDKKQAFACGMNKHGQCGIEGVDSLPLPTLVTRQDGSEFQVNKVACGDYHTLWTDSNDLIYSCGLGREGQLGHGDRSSQNSPKLIEFLKEKKIVKIASGGGFSSSHSVALTSTGELFTWGSGMQGQLGHSNSKTVDIPTKLEYFGTSEKSPIIDIACGWLHTVVLTGNLKIEEIPIQIEGYSLGNFDIISNEILYEIFAYCGFKELARLSCVNLLFRSIANSEKLWEKQVYLELNSKDYEYIKSLALEQVKSVGWKRVFHILYAERHKFGDIRYLKVTNFFLKIFHNYVPSKLIKGKKECSGSMLGLDAVGKTSILYKIRKSYEIITTIPTIGLNVETLVMKNLTITSWDVGGGARVFPLWRHYFQNQSFLIYVCDANEQYRQEEDRVDLKRILNASYFPELKKIAILVFANKQDLPNARSVHKLAADLLIHELADGRPYYIQPCIATTGEGIQEGLEWLANTLERLANT